MKYIRVGFRLVMFILVSLLAAIFAIIGRGLGFKFTQVFVFYNLWKKVILFTLNIKIEQEGEVPTTPGILMGNHRSYIDIALTPSKIPFVIVAKRQVRSWPIIGWGGRAIGTIWVQRESKQSRHETRESIKDRLSKGGSVLIYPEGTTFKGPGILDLKPKMFETCAENGFPIHPFALEYKDRSFAWIDDDLFMPHFVKHFGKPAVHVKVKYGQTITGTNGEQLMEKVHNWMDQTVREMRADWDNENEAQ